jgi:hypothetical protein
LLNPFLSKDFGDVGVDRLIHSLDRLIHPLDRLIHFRVGAIIRPETATMELDLGRHNFQVEESQLVKTLQRTAHCAAMDFDVLAFRKSGCV